jgi:transcriptional regulator with XRE-family HTH domain
MLAKKKNKKKRSDRRSSQLTTGSGAPAVVARTLEHAIGAQIRDYRKAAGLTVSDLADTADISTALLSRIENGQLTASLGTLQQLAAALNMPLSMLLASFEGKRGCSFVKRGEGVSIRRRGTKVGHDYKMLGESLAGSISVEPYLITLGKDAVPYTEFRHEGIEFIYMLEGDVSYAHGDRSYRLTPGDSILFDSAEFHGPDKLNKLPAIYLSIIVFQRP